MRYDIDYIQELLVEKMAGTISEEDNLLVEHVLKEDDSTQLLWKVLSDRFNAIEGVEFLKEINTDQAWLNVKENLNRAPDEVMGKSRQIPLTWKTLSIAALVLATISVALLLWIKYQEVGPPSLVEHAAIDWHKRQVKSSAGNKAVLMLANGETIVLDSAENGVLIKTGAIEVSKTSDGQLVYQVKTQSDQNPENGGLNTITTPPGGQYQVILPDNSKVWLNAASSLKFPTSFNGKSRNVELIGEAYFDVAEDKSRPFIVKSRLGEIEVLGTGFNVMAYADERVMKTTLVEGSVKIKGRETRVLKPGEQAVLNAYRMKIANVDVQEAIAWKNNLFQFNETSIDVIMRQATRWYNVEVKYAGKIPNRSFTGKISRNVSLNEFLEMLKYTGVNFKIEGKQITVL